MDAMNEAYLGGMPGGQRLAEMLESIQASIRALPGEIAREVERVIKEHAAATAKPTPATIETVVTRVLERHGPPRVPQGPAHVPEEPHRHETTLGPQPRPVAWPVLYGAPANFKFPRGTMATLWQHWCTGDPPLRMLCERVMPSRDLKRRLSEVRRLMAMVEALLTTEQLAEARASAEHAARHYSAVRARLPVARVTAKGRARRAEQLSWRTYAREIRK